jgi:preprotein translocase subunit YajC
MLFQILLQQAGGLSAMGQFVPFILIIIVFYFFMIRPQQKKAKDAKTFRESIKRGDNVVTIGGVHGKVAQVDADDTVQIEVAPGVRLKFEKSAISMESSKKVQPETK